MSELSHDIPFEERTIGHQLALRRSDAPNKPFLSIGSKSWTFLETDDLARAYARGLKTIGIEAGDHIVLMLPNCAEFAFAWFGNALVGAVTISIDPRKTGTLLEYTITDAMPRCLVISSDLLASLESVALSTVRSIEQVVVVGANGHPGRVDGARQMDWDKLLVFEGPDPEIAADFRAVGMVMYTSGSSGPAKGVIMPNAHMFSTGVAMMRAVNLSPNDVLFSPFPLFHGMTSRVGLLPALAMGLRITIGERFSARAYWREADACGATIGIVVPTISTILMAQTPGPSDRQHRVRALFNSKYEAAFERRFGVELIESYGMTEISHVISATYAERRPGSAGRRQQYWDVRILDDSGTEVPQGTPGEIVVRPELPWIMMKAYLNKPRETAEAIRNGWFYTGDYGFFDPQGYFYFTGRKAERIRRLGENVSAEQLENIVNEHPAIVESAALPHPSPLGEDDIRLVAAVREGHEIEPASLSKWLRERLPRFMRPRYIELLPTLPRTESGKVAKLALLRQGLSNGYWDADRST